MTPRRHHAPRGQTNNLEVKASLSSDWLAAVRHGSVTAGVVVGLMLPLPPPAFTSGRVALRGQTPTRPSTTNTPLSGRRSGATPTNSVHYQNRPGQDQRIWTAKISKQLHAAFVAARLAPRASDALRGFIECMNLHAPNALLEATPTGDGGIVVSFVVEDEDAEPLRSLELTLPNSGRSLYIFAEVYEDGINDEDQDMDSDSFDPEDWRQAALWLHGDRDRLPGSFNSAQEFSDDFLSRFATDDA